MSNNLENSSANGLNGNVEISGFLKQLSNDMRMPLNDIVGCAEAISHESISTRARDGLLEIRLAANIMTHIAADMIDLVRIINNEIEIADDEYCFENLALDVRRTIEKEAEQKALKTIIDIDPSIPYRLFGDESRIKSMLGKLITNAIRVTESGNIVFAVKCLPAGDGKVFLKFDVSDSGDGVLEEDIVKVLGGKGATFDQGNRGVESASIGIFLTKYFAGCMGGKLSVKATPGKGCTFTLLISQRTVGVTTMGDIYEDEAEQISSEKDIPFTAETSRVLIAQKNLEEARMNRKKFGKFMIHADITGSSKEAVNLVGRIYYDMLLIDADMPELSGFEAAKTVRALAKVGNEDETYFSKLPIIGLVDKNTGNLILEAEEAGMNECVLSPADNTRLEKILSTYLPVEKIKYASEITRDGNGLASLEALGLNIREALANFAGDEDEYKEVLLTMCRSSDTKITMLKYYLEQHDYKNYIVAIHGILGVAQVIGADEIAARSRELERAAKQGMREVIERETESFGDAFDKLLTSVRSAIMSQDKNSNKGAIDKEDLIAIINELRVYLADYQLNEVETLFFTLAQFSYPNNRVMELIHVAEEQMLSYSYNEVIATLDSVIAELNAE